MSPSHFEDNKQSKMEVDFTRKKTTKVPNNRYAAPNKTNMQKSISTSKLMSGENVVINL